MSIMDFVLIGAAVLFALIGIVRGGAKLFFGLFMLLVIMVGTAFLSSLICPLFLQSGKGDTIKFNAPATALMKPISDHLPKDGTFGELLEKDVVAKEDGVLYVGDKALKTIVSEKIPYVGSYIAPFLEKAIVPNKTLRDSLSFTIVKYIYEIAVWIVLVIIFVIVRNIFRKKIYRFLDHHSVPSKIDRAIGVVFSLSFLLVVFWGAGMILGKLDDGANWAHTANTFILKGVISKPFFKFNPLLKLIHVSLPVVAAAE